MCPQDDTRRASAGDAASGGGYALGVPINLRFTDNQKLKKVADLFGARIAASGTALPNSDPVTIKGGDLKVG